jgi:hypothetical protein
VKNAERLDGGHGVDHGDEVGSAPSWRRRQLGAEVCLDLLGQDGPEFPLDRDEGWFIDRPSVQPSTDRVKGGCGPDSEVDIQSASLLVVGSSRQVGFDKVPVLLQVSGGNLSSQIVDAGEVAEQR